MPASALKRVLGINDRPDPNLQQPVPGDAPPLLESVESLEDMLLDASADSAEPAVPQQDITFFRLSSSRVGRHRLLQLPAVAAKSLGQTVLAITIHDWYETASGCFVNTEPMAASGLSSALALMSADYGMDVHQLQDALSGTQELLCYCSCLFLI